VGRETNRQRKQRQAATAREKAAAARAEQQRAEQRRRAMVILSTVATLAVIAAVIVVVVLNSKQSTTRATASQGVLGEVTSVAPSTWQQVGEGGAHLLVQPTSGDPALTSGGKPELLYVGGEFCPICAAERWSMIQALSRFGTFSGLSEIRSAVDDGNLATFTFYKSSYTSKYLTFTPVENQDRNHDTLEKMTPAQSQIFGKYTNGFPFLYFGGKYYQTSAGYDPTTLSGLNQNQVAAQLKNPSSPVAKSIIGEANNLTAAICTMTNNQPAKVCTNPAITSLQSQLHA
jgi:hypothetical protein